MPASKKPLIVAEDSGTETEQGNETLLLVDDQPANLDVLCALLEEKEKGSRYAFVKLDIEGNKPAENAYVYSAGGKKNIGWVTSAMWSPSAKANIALAMVSLEWAGKGSELLARCSSGDHQAIVVDVPFIDPQKQRAKSPQQ